MVGNVIQLKKCLAAIRSADCRAFLDEMSSEAIDSTFRESLATGLASVLVSVAGVVQFGTSSEMLKNQSCRITLVKGLQYQKVTRCCRRAPLPLEALIRGGPWRTTMTRIAIQ